MPSQLQFEIVKQQCNSFQNLGYYVFFDMQPAAQGAAPKIEIKSATTSWRFCDPDWDVVSQQLTELYKNVKKRKNASQKPINLTI